MTKLATKMTVHCIICLGAVFTTNVQADPFCRGMSDAEYYFLLDAGLIDECEFDNSHTSTQTTTSKSNSSSTKGVSGLDLGSGRFKSVSGLDLGSGRYMGVSGLDLGSGR